MRQKSTFKKSVVKKDLKKNVAKKDLKKNVPKKDLKKSRSIISSKYDITQKYSKEILCEQI